MRPWAGWLWRKIRHPVRRIAPCSFGQRLHLPDLRPVLREFARVLGPTGQCIFSVTHPDMDWEGYELLDQDPTRFRLPQHADIFHHKFSHYFEAIEEAGFAIDRLVQLPVSEKIKHLLTDQAFITVKGRYQIMVMRLTKRLEGKL
jgi:SAM-dependent methyltransferase